MPYSNAGKNLMLDALAPSHMSLHSAYPGDTGANELAGGSYARQANTWNAAASGSKDNSNTPSFNVPAASTVAFIGFWSALTVGTFYGSAPNGGGATKLFTVDDIATEVLDSMAHGFANGDTVVVYGTGLPTGLVEGTVYFVVGATTNTLQLSATSGGAAINLTAVGAGLLQKIVVETFTGAGTHQVTDADLDLNAA